MIVWLASYPRSGNTLFINVCRHVFGFAPYSIYETTPVYLSPEEFGKVHKSPEPYLVKTHAIPKDQFPAIYIVRDGRDVLVSYTWRLLEDEGKINVVATSPVFLNYLRNMIENDRKFSGWGPNVLSWINRSERPTIVKFEDLVKDPVNIVEHALIKMSFRPQRIPGVGLPPFAVFQSKNPHLYRQGKIGAWKTEMPPDLQELFWQHHGPVMQKLGYPR
ncbi:MAG: sulfotransferase domain-containing protein [Anaerolineae bacterium]|nr:sulfotransferase domain-containing protein [Anaerolineae bacterium]